VRSIAYTLEADGRTPRPIDPDTAWSEINAELEARGAYTVAKDRVGDRRVSTVFMGVDLSFGRAPRPVLWETAVFAPDDEVEIRGRYASRDDAEKGHGRVVAELQEKTGDPTPG
jgi:hypothetical protein